MPDYITRGFAVLQRFCSFFLKHWAVIPSNSTYYCKTIGINPLLNLRNSKQWIQIVFHALIMSLKLFDPKIMEQLHHISHHYNCIHTFRFDGINQTLMRYHVLLYNTLCSRSCHDFFSDPCEKIVSLSRVFRCISK